MKTTQIVRRTGANLWEVKSVVISPIILFIFLIFYFRQKFRFAKLLPEILIEKPVNPNQSQTKASIKHNKSKKNENQKVQRNQYFIS